MRPNFIVHKYPNGLAQVMVMGGEKDDDELWFDRSGIPEEAAERYKLLVEAAYDLGIAHIKKQVAAL